MAEPRSGLALGRATTSGLASTVIPEVDVVLPPNSSALLRYTITIFNVTDSASYVNLISVNAHRVAGAAVVDNATGTYSNGGVDMTGYIAASGSDGLIRVTIPGIAAKSCKYTAVVEPIC